MDRFFDIRPIHLKLQPHLESRLYENPRPSKHASFKEICLVANINIGGFASGLIKVLRFRAFRDLFSTDL